MGFIIVSMFILLTISLFEYMDRTEWDELANSVESSIIRNKKYGAYRIRNQQYLLTAGILLGVIVSVFVYMGVKTGIESMASEQPPLRHEASQDTTQFALNTQNEMELPPSNFNHNGNNGDNMPKAQDGARHTGQNPDNTDSEQEPPRKERPQGKNETAAEFQERMEREMRGTSGDEAREKIRKEREKWEQDRKNNSKNQKVDGGKGGTSGVDAGPKGETDVTWNFPSGRRNAHQNNDGNVKVPGYTCGEGINGKVVVNIKVNSNGDVIDATIKSNSTGSSCCSNQALNYAKNKSRFEYSTKDVMEGTITYIFTYK